MNLKDLSALGRLDKHQTLQKSKKWKKIKNKKWFQCFESMEGRTAIEHFKSGPIRSALCRSSSTLQWRLVREPRQKTIEHKHEQASPNLSFFLRFNMMKFRGPQLARETKFQIQQTSCLWGKVVTDFTLCVSDTKTMKGYTSHLNFQPWPARCVL